MLPPSSGVAVTRRMLLLLLVLLTVAPKTTTLTEAAAASASNKCGVDCGPHGSCLLDTVGCPAGTSCQWDCHCQPGWGGITCAVQIDRCGGNATITYAPDGPTVCYHGGLCVTSTAPRPSVFATSSAAARTDTRCDCQAATGQDQVYAGHQCEYAAEAVCERDRAFSSYAFCVHGGSCREMVAAGAPHPLCACPRGTSGRHCQFASDQAPPDELVYVDTNAVRDGDGTAAVSGASMSRGIWFLLVALLVAFGAFIVGTLHIRRKRRRQWADGTSLEKEATGKDNGVDRTNASAVTGDDDDDDGGLTATAVDIDDIYDDVERDDHMIS